MRQFLKCMVITVVALLLSISCAMPAGEKVSSEEMIEVLYCVYAPKEVKTISATYTNPDGATEQVTGLRPFTREEEDIQILQ